jgi:hypothetical protein
MMGTMINPASGSAQYQPSIALRSNPINKMADKYTQALSQQCAPAGELEILL